MTDISHIVLLLSFGVSLNGFERLCDSNYMRNPIGICGYDLLITILKICGNNTTDIPFRGRRSTSLRENPYLFLSKLHKNRRVWKQDEAISDLLRDDRLLKLQSFQTPKRLKEKTLTQYLLDRQTAQSVLGSPQRLRRRYRRGIHCECCHNRCSQGEMHEFCKSKEQSIDLSKSTSTTSDPLSDMPSNAADLVPLALLKTNSTLPTGYVTTGNGGNRKKDAKYRFDGGLSQVQINSSREEREAIILSRTNKAFPLLLRDKGKNQFRVKNGSRRVVNEVFENNFPKIKSSKLSQNMDIIASSKIITDRDKDFTIRKYWTEKQRQRTTSPNFVDVKTEQKQLRRKNRNNKKRREQHKKKNRDNEMRERWNKKKNSRKANTKMRTMDSIRKRRARRRMERKLKRALRRRRKRVRRKQLESNLGSPFALAI